MKYLHTWALDGIPLPTLLLLACVLVSVRTLKRSIRVLRDVRARGTEPLAEMWAVTQVRIEWCILLSLLFALLSSSIATAASGVLIAISRIENDRMCNQLGKKP